MKLLADGHVFGCGRCGVRRVDTWRDLISRKSRAYRDAAGIDCPITLHGLRHGFCTMLAKAGKSAVVIKELARHRSIETSMRYVHMAQRHLRSEIDSVFG